MNILKKAITVLLSVTVLTAAGMSMSASAINSSDPNGNGKYDISDVIYIMTYLNGEFEPTDLNALDVDENGIISLMDAKLVQYYIAEIWDGD